MTERDEAILDTLTRRVRVLSVAQVASTWWSGSPGIAAAKSRLRVLEGQGWLLLVGLLARPLPSLETPVVTWSPGDREPDFGAVSYRLRSRWNQPACRILAVVATDQAGSRHAGKGGRVPRASEATHDLCLSAVYLRMLEMNPKRARRWISEAMLYERGEGRDSRLPDAAIVTRAGTTAIEFGGAYAPAKVADFHGFCADRGWEYELW